MAEPPSDVTNVSQATVLEFVVEYEAAERAISEAASVKSAAVSVRKRLRKRIETAGITLAQFERARADAAKPPELREREDREHRQLLEFMLKPPGFQASMDIAPDASAAVKALNTAELKRIDGDGFDAGKAGHPRDGNPHEPGSEGYQRWDTAYMRARAEHGETNGTTPRRRGRPRTPPPQQQPVAEAYP